MSLASVRQDIRAWLNNVPLSYMPDSRIDVFIAENIRTIERMYQWPWLDARQTFTVATGATSRTLPVNCMSLQSVFIIREGAYSRLEKITDEWRHRQYPSAGQTGIPTHYTIDAGRMYFVPVPKEAYRFERNYTRHTTSLATAASTNAFTEYGRNAVVMACMSDIYAFLNEPEQATYFQNKKAEAIQALIREQAFFKQEDYRPKLQAGIRQYRNWFRRR